MATGSSFYLVLSFKVEVGNGFRDSFSQLLQRAIRDTQVALLSLSFLARRVTTFVQPSAKTVTINVYFQKSSKYNSGKHKAPKGEGVLVYEN